MVSVQDCRKALGSRGEQMSDKEIEMVNERMSRLASVLFDNWNKRAKTATDAVRQDAPPRGTI